MADKDIADTWKDAEKLLDKGKYEEALSVLRQVDADGKEATTLRLAGKAMHLKAGKPVLLPTTENPQVCTVMQSKLTLEISRQMLSTINF